MELPFTTLDVFTTTRFQGNPLAVVTVPAALPEPPSQAQKQAVAREFNLSETVFVHEPRGGEDPNGPRRIDIFLTHSEIPFAGHPTIGAAVSLLPLGVTRLVTKAGPIAVHQTGGQSVKLEIPHNVHLHARHLQHLVDDGQLAASALPSDPEIRAAELAAPIFSIVKGMTFVLIELPSLDKLAAVGLAPSELPVDALLDDGWRQGFMSRYYYVRTGPSTSRDGVKTTLIRTRMIGATLEDPATGSAACTLSSFLSLGDQEAAEGQKLVYEVTQGVEMGRESNITIEVSLSGSSSIGSVHLAGAATKVMSGHITI